MSAPRELSLRDCGTQLKEKYLQPHLQKFSISSKEENDISRDRLHDVTVARKGVQTKNERAGLGQWRKRVY